MLQTGRSDPHLHSQDVFFRPPNWDSGSLHSLPQGRRQWQIKLLTHLFRGVGARSTASWLKWWVQDSEGSCIIGAQCCGVMFAKQGPAMKRAEIKSSVLNSASVITCKKKKKINYPCLQMHHFILMSFRFTLLLKDIMCFANGGKLQSITLHFIKLRLQSTPPTGSFVLLQTGAIFNWKLKNKNFSWTTPTTEVYFAMPTVTSHVRPVSAEGLGVYLPAAAGLVISRQTAPAEQCRIGGTEGDTTKKLT